MNRRDAETPSEDRIIGETARPLRLRVSAVNIPRRESHFAPPLNEGPVRLSRPGRTFLQRGEVQAQLTGRREFSTMGCIAMPIGGCTAIVSQESPVMKTKTRAAKTKEEQDGLPSRTGFRT